nr:retrovirus-related Pol polyprotein from transposon TNT 1-94 [Tanacetum cinerariifolium]
FGTIPTTIPDTTPVIAPSTTEKPITVPSIPPSPDYTPTSPDYSPASETESGPSEDPSSGHIPQLLAISPFLSSDDDTTDSDTPDTPPSPTHDTPFTEITVSTQRSPVQFLGHMIDSEGIHVDPVMIKAIKDWEPMTKLTQKSVKFDWGEKAKAAFQLLKQKLCSAQILALPEGSENFVRLSSKDITPQLSFNHLAIPQAMVMDLKLCYNTFKFKEGESLTQTFTRLPKKWLSFCQSLRNTNHVKNSELASLFGKLKYEENLIDSIYETEKNKSLISATPLSTAFFSSSIVQDFQDSPDDEEDTRSSQEYLNDLEEEYQARALLAKSKRFFKKEEVSSDDNEMVEAKVLMALAEENNAVDKESARNGEWVKISMRKVHTFLEMEDNDDRKVCLHYSCIDLNFVAEQRSNLLSKHRNLVHELNTCKEQLLVLKQAKLDFLTMQYVNTEILKENKNLRSELKELKEITKTWLNSSNKVNQCISEQIPSYKKKILGVDQLTEDPSSSGQKDLVFVKSSADDTKVTIPGVERPWFYKTKGFILPNHDTGRILPAESQRNKIDPSVAFTDSSATDYDLSDEYSVCSTPLPPLKKLEATDYDLSDEYSVCSTPLPPLKKLEGVKPIFGSKTIKSILKLKSTLKAEALKGVIKMNYPQLLPRVTKALQLQELTQLLGEALQAKKAEALKSTRAESSNANRSKTPTKSGCSRHMTGVKSYLHKYVEQPGPKVVFGDDSTCTTKGYGSIKCNGIVFTKCDIRKPIWYLDSGCSRHITGVKSYLHKYVEQPGPKVVFGDDSTCTTKGYGSIKCNGIVFTKVAFINGLKYNLISISQLCDAKYIVLFDEKRGTIFNYNKEIVMIAPRVRDVYVLDMTSSAQESCFLAKASKNLSWLWHKRLAHLNLKTINKLAKQNLVIGLPSLVYSKDKPCLSFEKGKHHRDSFKTKHTSSIKKCLHLLHMDLFGPINPRSINHEKYTLFIVDEYSSPGAIKFLKPSVDNINIAESERYPPDEYLHPYEPSQRWSQDKHIELVNIIGNPGARMLTRAVAKQLSAASAHECLFVDFLLKKSLKRFSLKEEPKKVFEALKHPGWVDAMQDELNQFARNKHDINGSSVKTPMVPPNNLGPDLNGKAVNETQYKGNSDSEYTGCNMDRKSTSGEAEYVAAAGCCANILWMKIQLTDYDIIYKKQLGDIFTKPLDEPTFKRLIVELGEVRGEIGITTFRNALREDLIHKLNKKTREKIVPYYRFISLLLEHMAPNYDHKELTINPTRVFSVHNWILNPNQPKNPPFTDHMKAICILDMHVDSKAPKYSSPTE